jgi:hypothetical protein
MSDPWQTMLPTVTTSVLTTLATLGVTFGVGSLSRRSKKRLHPILIKRGSGSSFDVINQSKLVFTSLSVYITAADGQWRDSGLGYPPAVLPQHSVHINTLHAGEVISISGCVFRHGKEQYVYFDPVRIREEIEEYQPRRLDEPPMSYGG